MTLEDKELLLKDLCARLPYGVIVNYKENEFEIPHWKITTIYPDTFDGWIGYNKRIGVGSESGSRHFKIGEIKPYLRTMSSMTEEEKRELEKIIDGILGYNVKNYFHSEDDYNWNTLYNTYDWLNAHHFDYRGLIPKGLALEASEDIYKNETI